MLKSAPKPEKEAKEDGTRSDAKISYDDFKTHEGQRYTGMKIGRSHKWYYDQGEWRETKVTPDLAPRKTFGRRSDMRSRTVFNSVSLDGPVQETKRLLQASRLSGRSEPRMCWRWS